MAIETANLRQKLRIFHVMILFDWIGEPTRAAQTALTVGFSFACTDYFRLRYKPDNRQLRPNLIPIIWPKISSRHLAIRQPLDPHAPHNRRVFLVFALRQIARRNTKLSSQPNLFHALLLEQIQPMRSFLAHIAPLNVIDRICSVAAF